ncbi:MAG: hypothetical protein Q4C70_04280 [Planctomycetia bacterium]|nr:hypothetical protein [Planctomycetia bacterium]
MNLRKRHSYPTSATWRILSLIHYKIQLHRHFALLNDDWNITLT